MVIAFSMPVHGARNSSGTQQGWVLKRHLAGHTLKCTANTVVSPAGVVNASAARVLLAKLRREKKRLLRRATIFFLAKRGHIPDFILVREDRSPQRASETHI